MMKLKSIKVFNRKDGTARMTLKVEMPDGRVDVSCYDVSRLSLFDTEKGQELLKLILGDLDNSEMKGGVDRFAQIIEHIVHNDLEETLDEEPLELLRGARLT